ncbi:MAG TPA: hypothetical protein VF281_03735 [Candidatus Saccharimonadales bacterium]
MSELPPTPQQADIDRDGGLYDQARTEDGLRRLSQRLEQNEAYATYAENIAITQKREQDEAYATYGENIQATQVREQEEAYATYEGNIQYTQQREAYEAYWAEQERLRIAQEEEDAELRELKKDLRKKKINRGFGRVAATASMIPGIASVADLIQEGVSTSQNNKRRRNRYRQQNGTMFGNKSKGYGSILGDKFKTATGRDDEGKKQDLIIKDLSTLIKEKEQRRQQ